MVSRLTLKIYQNWAQATLISKLQMNHGQNYKLPGKLLMISQLKMNLYMELIPGLAVFQM